MQQNNNDFINTSDISKEKKNEKMEDWRNEHGQPNFKFLQSLANEGSPLALEKLKSIAEDLNVAYDHNISGEELVKKIILATQSGFNTTT